MMAGISPSSDVQIEYIDVAYTFHLSNGETRTVTIKTYACPRCSTPMLHGSKSTHPSDARQWIASYVCPRCDFENVRIEAKE